jgi:hypothetical protein
MNTDAEFVLENTAVSLRIVSILAKDVRHGSSYFGDTMWLER